MAAMDTVARPSMVGEMEARGVKGPGASPARQAAVVVHAALEFLRIIPALGRRRCPRVTVREGIIVEAVPTPAPAKATVGSTTEPLAASMVAAA